MFFAPRIAENYPYFTRLKAYFLPNFLIFLSLFRTLNNIFTLIFEPLNEPLIITFRFSSHFNEPLNEPLSEPLTIIFPLFKSISQGEENKNGLQTIQR